MLQLEDPLAQWTQTLTLYFMFMALLIYDYAFPVWYLQNYQIHFRVEIEWFNVAKVSIWTIILKTTTQNEVKNADMQNVLHFERLKECCWEVSVIKSVCRIFCNRLRCCKFAQRKRWYQFLKKFAEFCLQNYWKNCAQKNLFCAKIG